MSDPTRLGLTVTNKANGQAVVYIGVAATLDIQLINATGTDLTIPNDGSAQFTCYFPDFYSNTDIAAMRPDLAKMPGWTAAADGDHLVVTFTGPAAVWSAGQVLAFSLANVATSATGAVTDQTLQVNAPPIGDLPPAVQVTLALIAQSPPGSLPLTRTLHLSLASQGVVYVSNASDPLSNQLTLYLTNIGDRALYDDATPAASPPEVIVTFLYGATSGALAPADKQDGRLGSAWNIEAAVTDSSGGSWVAANPRKPSTDASPSWKFTAADPGVLGTGAARTVAFTFSSIVSFLAPGLTQLVMHCRNFARNAATRYEDTVFFLDIVKQYPPARRGLVGFDSPVPMFEVYRPDQPVTIPLQWTATETNRVLLLSNHAGVQPYTARYGKPAPALTYDSTTVTLAGVERPTTLLLTLQAFDGADRYLNSLQFAGYINTHMYVDPAGKSYPVVRIGQQLWMAADLAYDVPGSWPAQHPEMGRVYTAAAALPSKATEGWRLPTKDDWDTLVSTLGGPQEAYTALIAGGRAGFDARPGGTRDDHGNFGDVGNVHFWTATPGPAPEGEQYSALFVGRARGSLLTFFHINPGFGLAVRYVRDAA